MNGIRVFCHWIYFHLRSKIFLWSSYGWISHLLGFQSEQVVGLYMLTTSCCQVDLASSQLYVVHYGNRAFTHVRPVHQ